MPYAPTKRLAALASLLPADIDALEAACEHHRVIARNRPVCGREVRTEPIMLLQGWAGQVRLAANGKHQLLGLILPGDIVQAANEHHPFIALTDVVVAKVPSTPTHSAISDALEWSRQLDLEYLYNQVSRIGGMGAGERLLDLITEIYKRLLLSGLIDDNSFDLPLTQLMIGDLLAITAVHTNRMIQEARMSGELSWKKSRVTIREGGSLDRQARSRLSMLGKAVGMARSS